MLLGPLLWACLLGPSVATPAPAVFPRPLYHDHRNDFYCHTPSLHTVSGPGLRRAHTKQRTFFDIQWAAGARTALYIWAANEHYMFAGEVNTVDGKMVGSYIVDYPGEYELHVEEFWWSQHQTDDPNLHRCGNDRYAVLPGSPFRLNVTGEPANAITAPQRLPRCISQKGWLFGHGWLDGAWVSARLASHRDNVLRYGWVYQPRYCSFDVFSHQHLQAAAQAAPKWLVFLGTSIQRGIFLTLVDLLLNSAQKAGVYDSITFKCWGWADFRFGNLRLSYGDWRIHSCGAVNETVCHGEYIYSHDGAVQQRNGWALVDFVFSGETWPDAVVVEPRKLGMLTELLNRAPAAWTGRYFLLGSDSNINMWTADTYFKKLMETKAIRLRRTREMEARDPRVLVYWTYPALVATLHDLEFRGRYTSLHYHRLCNEVSPQGLMVICSLEREMVAHILLGLLLGPKKRFEPFPPVVPTNVSSCNDCPPDLFPLHINPKPDPVCVTAEASNFSFQLVPRMPPKSMMGRHAVRCPAWCLQRPPDGVQAVNSGSVDVRRCKRDSR
eukprot:EG_transcript_7011